MLRRFILCLLLALAAPIMAHADNSAQPVPTDGKCPVPADPAWTKQEQFVWRSACLGKEANFNKEPGYGDDRDPKGEGGLPDSRILRSSFLETILLKDKYRSALTRLGVRITGARFTERLDLQHAELRHEVWLDRSLLEKGIDLSEMKTSSRLTFEETKIVGQFDADAAQIDDDLSMKGAELVGNVDLAQAHVGSALGLDGAKIAGDVDLTQVHVGSALSLEGVKITGLLNMNTVDIGHYLFMDGQAQFKAVDLVAAHIGGQLSLSTATVSDKLDMSGVVVDRELFADEANFDEINLGGGRVASLSLSRTKVNGALNLNMIDIRQNLYLRGGAQFKNVSLVGAHIGGQLDLGAATVVDKLSMNGIVVDRDLFAQKAKLNEVDLGSAHVASLDLTGATVAGDLNLNTINVRQSLFLDDGAHFRSVNLIGAHIGGTLSLHTATVTGKLDMNGIVVDRNVFADDAKFNDVDLGNAHVASLNLTGATVDGALNLSTINVRQNLFLGDRAQFNSIDLIEGHIGGQLNLQKAAVADKLGMNGIVVDQDLLADDAKFGEIDLRGGHVVSLSLNGAEVTGMLNMDGLHIDQDLTMSRKARFKDIHLDGGHIGRSLFLDSSTVTGELNMNGARIEESLIMNSGARFNDISLIGAQVAGQFNLESATVEGEFMGNYLAVDHTVFFGNGAEFMDEIALASAKLGHDLFLSQGSFRKRFDLTDTHVVGALGLEKTKWLDDATLDLTGASAGRIDLSDNWPDKMQLNGFVYRNLFNVPENISKQAEDWFKKQDYTPQPYEQLASVLQAGGRFDDAIDVRYAGKDAELRAASGWRRIGLILLKWSIGFGYRLQDAFAWALGFVLLGWAVLWATGQRTKHGATLGLVYSFDMLLPLVQLSKKHDDVELDAWPRRYFYVHKLIGVILASFIVAGISGLTK